jgi:hypothetical protein
MEVNLPSSPQYFNGVGSNYIQGERQKVKDVRHDNVFIAGYEV